MSDAMQTQIDDFGLRLYALERELEELRRQVAADAVAVPEPATRPAPAVVSLAPPAPSGRLQRARTLLQTGAVREAVRELDRLRAASFGAGSVVELEEILELIGPIRAPALERLIYAVRANLEYLRGPVAQGGAQPAAPAPTPEVAAWTPAPSPAPEPLVAEPRRPSVTLSDLLGPRALAISGGIVTLLGIVFFFVLAVNRGWIGPAGRVGLGAAASGCVFAVGIVLRRRYGPTHSALAATAAGIAGGYATLLAAAVLYGMVPAYAALVVAAGIAGVGVATALRWRSELIGGLGLLGAMLVPLAAVAQDGLTPLGTGFVAVMLAATGIVAIRECWNGLFVAGLAASAPQIAALVFRPQYEAQAPPRIVALTAVFALLYLAVGIGRQLRGGGPRLGHLATAPIMGSSVLAAGAAERLFGTTGERGGALLAIAAFYAVACVPFFRRRSTRDLSALLAAVAFTVGAIGLGQTLSGQPLAYAWAGEAAALAWLARRTREIRFQAWSAIYVLLAVVHVVAIDAPPKLLLVAGERPLHGAAPAAAVAVAASVFALYARPWTDVYRDERGVLGIVAPLLRGFEAQQAYLRSGALWLTGVAATYGLSLAVLSGFASFDWGHVALSGIWCAIGVAVLLASVRGGSANFSQGALIWLAATGALVVAHGAHDLAPTPRAASFLVIAAAYLAAAFAHQLLGRRELLSPITAGATVLSLGLAWDALATLLHGRAGVLDLRGAGLLGLGVVYASLAAAVFRRRDQRDFASLLGAAAVVLLPTAAAMLLSGTYLVLAWAAGGVLLAWVSLQVREPRLLLPSAGFLAAALGHTLVFEAPPQDLFQARHDPATGVPAVALVAVAIALGSHYGRDAVAYLTNARRIAWWTSGALGVYAVSLSILALAQYAFPHASLQTEFQRGHTTVSAFWGALGLALLYLGLTRWRSLRVAGFALFAVSLAKIFLYDLPSLSSLTRALSFLAVGAVLLLGGFFYQRLSLRLDETA
jgi:uncharacterized membrane protein